MNRYWIFGLAASLIYLAVLAFAQNDDERSSAEQVCVEKSMRFVK